MIHYTQDGKVDRAGWPVLVPRKDMPTWPTPDELADALDSAHAQIKALREALRNVLPVAEETCKQWPNDDCYLVPTEQARRCLAAPQEKGGGR